MGGEAASWEQSVHRLVRLAHPLQLPDCPEDRPTDRYTLEVAFLEAFRLLLAAAIAC